MTSITFGEAVRRSIQKDPRYHPAAYELVRDALHVAAKKFRDENADDQHVSGQELLAGFREHVLSEYGPMSTVILDQWGLQRGEDVGNIVYNLIACGYFGKNEGDSLEDFAGGYDFATAFAAPFLPSSQRDTLEKKSP
ncbi:Minf_1886 family protein [Prosthecobacter sp.]|uniref:Minf_1886 family protein n=1 Tax=Prosthecobacter sp. TaxID=1965333 RepID=UPI001DCA011A|nr:Minf_1886 family protein [Prosthecobacter sp.]MCB1277232.1 hypothetical protein [Prosthecobacter sp.]